MSVLPLRHALPGAALLTVVLLFGAACDKSATPPPELAAPPAARSGTAIPAAATTDPAGGEALFVAHCARCHGERGVGTRQGPPLVDRIYEPNHHPDAAFYRAAAMGVRAHHWQFGDMPAVGATNTDQVTAIIGYVRALQREAGIY